jgi:DNA-binding LytR/AlgR family response regulator
MVQKLKCMIIDDEPVARQVIKELAEDIDFLEISAEAANPVAANNVLQKQTIDLLFLDINMPRINGIDFLKQLALQPLTIITTAYPEFALQGFELDVVDYLVKPISFERFLKSANKAYNLYNLQQHPCDEEEFFFVKCDLKIEKIVFNDIGYIEGLANYVAIYTNQRKYVAYLTFKKLIEQLPKDQFIRAHRSYFVSLRALQSIEGNEAILTSGKKIPIGNLYKQEMMQYVNNRLFKR